MAGVKKGYVRITDKKTGKSTEKPKRSLRDKAKRAAVTRGDSGMVTKIVNRDKVIDQATGRTADVHRPVR